MGVDDIEIENVRQSDPLGRPRPNSPSAVQSPLAGRLCDCTLPLASPFLELYLGGSKAQKSEGRSCDRPAIEFVPLPLVAELTHQLDHAVSVGVMLHDVGVRAVNHGKAIADIAKPTHHLVDIAEIGL
jgi:hypothetical protein